MFQGMSYWIRRFELLSKRSEGFPEGWAIIVIDSKGLLSAWTDFGNYVYHWTSFGDDFPKFLLGLDDYYLSRKLAGKDRDVYDSEATRKAVEEALKEELEASRMDESTFDTEQGLIRQFNRLYDKDDFQAWLRETSLSEAWNYGRMSLNPQLQGFLTNIWPRFKTLLQSNTPQPSDPALIVRDR